MNKIALFVLLFLLCTMPVRSSEPEPLVSSSPKHALFVKGGFDLAQLDDYGAEVMAVYQPYIIDWLRIGPALQFSYFICPERNWFKTDNVISGGVHEFRGNLMATFDFVPFASSTFYVGIAPYLGFQSFFNRGSIYNPSTPLDITYDYQFTTFDYGLRFELGGFLDKHAKHGLEGHVQFSTRGAFDESPLTDFFMLTSMDYKSYVGLSYIYRIL